MALRVRVCTLAEVHEGQINAFKVRGVTWPVLVTIVDGELIACPGVCPHEDVSLADGDLEGSQIRCAGHGYLFDLHTGTCKHDPGLQLRRYPLTRVGDEIWVDLL